MHRPLCGDGNRSRTRDCLTKASERRQISVEPNTLQATDAEPGEAAVMLQAAVFWSEISKPLASFAVISLALVTGAFAGACSGTSREEASPPGLPEPQPFLSSGEALRRATAVRRQWQSGLIARAKEDRHTRFPNPPRRVLFERLQHMAVRYGFRVRTVRILRPLQAAPLVVVQTPNRLKLARDTRAILRVIDPKARTNDDRTGWAYEGFFFEAQDLRGVPFLIAYNLFRGVSPAGGQWARSERLYPFEHF